MMIGVHVRDEDELDVPHDVEKLLAAEETGELTERALAAIEKDATPAGDFDVRRADCEREHIMREKGRTRELLDQHMVT
jgi:hypothetical protein